MMGRLFSLIVALLPQHRLSRVVHGLARWRWRPWKNGLIRLFTRIYGVDCGEAAASEPNAYVSFNAFFTRPLAPGARPLAEGENRIVSPVDGVISQHGPISDGRLIQAKRQDYSVDDLLGGDPQLAGPFRHGHFATLYLSPRDYHRVHMPMTGSLQRMLHIPGRLFGVSPPLVRHVSRLFARNERVVTLFDTAAGPMAMVLVGAIGVGSIETLWSGEVTPPRGQRIRSWDFRHHPLTLEAGAEMGRFNLGSTVILLLADPDLRWSPTIGLEQPLRMGQALAETRAAEDSGAGPGEGDHLRD
ncbi:MULTISPECIES: archaetidylserine decarboxylase [Spiribacter]|nr:archaetidylserine decarboxylase [Spiribacter roseus]